MLTSGWVIVGTFFFLCCFREAAVVTAAAEVLPLMLGSGPAENIVRGHCADVISFCCVAPRAGPVSPSVPPGVVADARSCAGDHKSETLAAAAGSEAVRTAFA